MLYYIRKEYSKVLGSEKNNVYIDQIMKIQIVIYQKCDIAIYVVR